MSSNWTELENMSITAVPGFQAAGVACGLKNSKKDMAVICSEKETRAAGVFTQNLVQAAPVKLCKEHIKNPVRAVVVNSGNANACTGEQGRRDAYKMAEKVAEGLNLNPSQVLVCSTGVIGEPLAMDKVGAGIDQALTSLGRGEEFDTAAAEAILTTDTKIKRSAYRCNLPAGDFHLAGIAKGSGMICPNMATMLAFLVTDVNIEQALLQELFSEAANKTFNAITVDGETSTNDTALILAGGGSNKDEVEIKEGSEACEQFKALLEQVCRELAFQIVEDGEGLTKVINLTIKGAPDEEKGRIMARSVLNSPLVKTAFYGEDANWGRILAALGYSGVDFDPGKTDIFIGACQLARDGGAVPFSEVEMKTILQKKDIEVVVDLKQGPAEVKAWGTDMSHEYIRINSSYRS